MNELSVFMYSKTELKKLIVTRSMTESVSREKRRGYKDAHVNVTVLRYRFSTVHCDSNVNHVTDSNVSHMTEKKN